MLTQKKCLNFNLSSAPTMPIEFKALFNSNNNNNKKSPNLFILTLKLSFDDIQIGPRNIFAIDRMHLKGTHKRTFSMLAQKRSQSQFTEFLWI